MKDETTLDLYRSVVATILARYRGSFPGSEIQPSNFVLWLKDEGTSRQWSAATGRLYRAALIWHFECLGDLVLPGKLFKLDLGVPNPPVRLAASKQKSLPLADLAKLLLYLRDLRADSAEAVADWLISGSATGLRPVEWGPASLDTDTKMLVVQNAKTTNGRSHGPTRTLALALIDDYELAALARHVERSNAAHASGQWKQFYDSSRQMLLRSVRRIWPRRLRAPSLYSARHQLCANLKKAGWSLQEIAAVFGHASDATATRNYGRTAQGDRRASIQPTQADIDAVRLSSTVASKQAYKALKAHKAAIAAKLLSPDEQAQPPSPAAP